MKILFLISCFFITSLAAAQENYVVVFLNNNPDKQELPEDEVNDLQRQHLDNIGKMAREGELIMAGPFEGGGGIFIMNTPEIETAKKWILSDPAIRSNRWKIELLQITARIGKPCLANEDAAMVEKQFVRFLPHITKFNVQEAPRLFLEHDNYIDKIHAQSEVLFEGIFSNDDGGIMVFDSPVDKALLMNDPTAIEGMIIPEVKKIWIAEGSFCKGR
jgi:uncharacterized protein YciI